LPHVPHEADIPVMVDIETAPPLHRLSHLRSTHSQGWGQYDEYVIVDQRPQSLKGYSLRDNNEIIVVSDWVGRYRKDEGHSSFLSIRFQN